VGRVSILTLPSVAPLAKPRVSMVITVKDWEKKDTPSWSARESALGRRTGDPRALKKAVSPRRRQLLHARGVDYEAIREAIKTDWRREIRPRRSTITQQVQEPLPDTREDADPESEGDRLARRWTTHYRNR